ncbi:MAG TPA: hypothetical protein VII93_14800 [Anaerolineales bacterium]
MKYRPDIEQVIDRYQRFYASQEPGAILIHVFVDPDGKVPYDLRNYSFPELNENRRFIETYIANRECFLRGRLGVMDDYVPDIFIHHGIGIHSAYVAGGIEFSEDTSWSRPIIKTWDDLDRLTLSEDNVWFQVLRQTAELYAEHLRGKVGIATFYHYSPLDMANALRGNQLFLDFYDSPDQVKWLLDFCVKAVIWLETQLWPIVGDLAGGAPLWGSWLPGHALMMSEDIADLCKASDYPAWAEPWTQRVIDHFEGALIHNHSLGLHIQGKIAHLANLRVLQISEDPNRPRPFDHLEELLQAANGVPLQTYCRPEEVEQAVKLGQSSRMILQTSVPDVTAANEIVRYVRKHSRIKVG